VNRAVDAARRAFPAWSQTPSHVRAGYIRALAEQLKNRADEMAALITAELGMPVQWCRMVQVDGPIEGLESYAAMAAHMDEVREVGNSLIVKEAVGVCAFINPWNYPLHQLIGKLAPALAAGCTVVVKPRCTPSCWPTWSTPSACQPVCSTWSAAPAPRSAKRWHGIRTWTWSRSPAPPARASRSPKPRRRRSSACAWSWAASRRS